jgi:hypothetical protein
MLKGTPQLRKHPVVNGNFNNGVVIRPIIININ